MLSIYLFFLAFKIIATAVCMWLCWRIARTHIVPSYTYILFSMAFALRLFTQFQGLYYSGTVLGLLSQFSYVIIISSQFIEATITLLFLVGLSRKYKAVLEVFHANNIVSGNK